ncbi:hypothetical protein L107_05513 [Cyanobium sp. Copco_Reservoir_LC18]|uniref:DUF3593 domain-containing protein n=1 Tax=Cyanobium sp. Copco_Reservoir_LC18 TaxID=1328305 RepID=UPI00135B04A1|nr:DUF3593 domain-containing protein [Cyanobium sp. Copco_Reservoir_LC18]KAF0653801.1 hypothetical protein L107_05513 [Cyanobium sp. Copco_Reservoir_LC18]
MSLPLAAWFQGLGAIDPAPFFVLSLLPYLAFLWWARQVRAFPRLALRGFQLTLLFVAVTIAAAVVAQQVYGRQLADVDPLHGGAEAFLTLSNLVVLLGFRLLPEPAPEKGPAAGSAPPQVNKS